MTRWSAEGIARLVVDGKKNGRFDEQLIDEAVKTLKYRWNPHADWITFVPSLRDPNLVRDLAERLGVASICE